MQYLQKEGNDEVYFWHADKQQSFLQFDTVILGVLSQPCQKYPKQEVCISLQYLKENMSDVDFCLLINMQGFFKLILSFYVCVSGYVQITQNNKFAISLNYLKKEVSDKLIFCMQVSMKVSYKLIL